MTDDEIVEEIGKLREERSLFVLLIAPPGAGKSTFARKLDARFKFKIFIVDRYERGGLFTPESEKRELSRTLDINRSVIIDRLNIEKKTRAHYIRFVPMHYWCVAIDLNSVPIEELTERVQARPHRLRRIPTEVIEGILKRYEPPTMDEGFNYIYRRHAL